MADIREVIESVIPKQGKLEWGKPISSYKLTFDSQQAKLEPIYYWVLDFINDFSFNEDESKTITVSANDPDYPDDFLTFKCNGSDNIFCSI